MVYLVQRISARRLLVFHWLRAAERIKFQLVTLVFRCLHGTAPRYLSANFIRVADVPARRRLRSSTTNSLIVRPTRLVTVGDRTFPVAGANPWNSLSDDITALDSQATFGRLLKTSLFRESHPDFCCEAIFAIAVININITPALSDKYSRLLLNRPFSKRNSKQNFVYYGPSCTFTSTLNFS